MSQTAPRADHLEELDLSVPDLDIQADEEKAGAVLNKLHGVSAVRILEHGIWLSYHPAQITKEAVLTALAQAGFHATTFQDSASGETGSSPV